MRAGLRCRRGGNLCGSTLKALASSAGGAVGSSTAAQLLVPPVVALPPVLARPPVAAAPPVDMLPPCAGAGVTGGIVEQPEQYQRGPAARSPREAKSPQPIRLMNIPIETIQSLLFLVFIVGSFRSIQQMRRQVFDRRPSLH